MYINDLKNSLKLFYIEPSLGIVIYNAQEKEVSLFEFTNENMISFYNLKKIKRYVNVEQKDIFKVLYADTKNELLKDRLRNLIGETVVLFCSIDKNGDFGLFSNSKKFLTLSNSGKYEIKTIELEIIDTFGSKDDLKNESARYKQLSKDEMKTCLYGFWDIKTNEIKSSFVFSSIHGPMTCFDDLGTSKLNEGSLFLKFKIKELL